MHLYVRTRDLCNVRVKRVYDPRILRHDLVQWRPVGRPAEWSWGWTFDEQEKAEEWATLVRKYAEQTAP